MELKFKTFEKQRQALRHLRDTKTNEVLYGGGARGGKSYLGCGWVLMECLVKPGSKWLIAREELTKLKDTTLLTFFMVAKSLGVAGYFSYNAQSLTISFKNGSLIFFREIKYLPSDPQFDRLGSYDLTGSFLDECQQIHVKAINVLRGRYSVLSGEGWQTIPKSLYTCNPAKNWIYTDFVRPEKEGTLSDDKVFIKSLATDNPFVSEDYINNLKKSDKITVRRLLHGDFEYDDDPSALIEYDKILDCFTNDFEVLRGDKYMTVDVARFGKDKSIVALWDGWRVTLYSFKGLSITQLAEQVRAIANQNGIPMSDILADEDGIGGGLVDVLGCKGFVNNSRPLPDLDAPLVRNPKTGKMEPPTENYTNLKSQCSFRMADRINNSGLFVECEDIETKQRIIASMEQVKQYNMEKDGKRQVMPKDKVKEILGYSPDEWDTLMMREWFELQPVFELWSIDDAGLIN